MAIRQKMRYGSLIFAMFLSTSVNGPILYVDDSAFPNGDGTSWNTAYNFLQDALTNAVALGEESNNSAYRNQMQIGRKLIRKGKMSIDQYEAINASHTQIVYDRIKAATNVTQSQVDVVATAAAPLAGAGWLVRGLLAATEFANAGVDFCQGETWDGVFVHSAE